MSEQQEPRASSRMVFSDSSKLSVGEPIRVRPHAEETERPQLMMIPTSWQDNVLYANITKYNGVRLSRDIAFLSIDSRYRPSTFNWRLLTMIDDLHEMGIITQIRGERWGRNYAKVFGDQQRKQTTKQTELHSTEALNTLCLTSRLLRSKIHIPD